MAARLVRCSSRICIKPAEIVGGECRPYRRMFRSVGTMSEGFDFPPLKIAAIHIPHKSLETTLQFIGRLPRTNAERIGDAKFVACLRKIKTETQRLYVRTLCGRNSSLTAPPAYANLRT